ncbi:c-type cytochrome [Pararhizobium haloflavum]|uniref:c-type cytochrome n=1 Tax=Pararhizobium haloflavum TaxID=2037914 RepID=UPI001FE10940|nr:cytochrome c [Pararhizobium haloflavum]
MSHAHGIALSAAVGLVGLGIFLAMQTSGPPASGKAMTVVTVPELPRQAERGRAAFDESCASCHGQNAAGREGVGPPLVHRIYEPSHHADAAFLVAALNGARQHHWEFGNMEPVDGVSEAEVRDIIDYVRSLQRANGIE